MVDPFGVVRPAPRETPDEIVAEAAAGSRGACASALVPAPPSTEDVDMPPRLRAQLAPVAEAWSAEARRDGEPMDLEPRVLVDRFARRLRTFGYSLSVARDPHVDPVVDLLTAHGEGHCEMFASALVLLARTRGIPARVVTGFRVSEMNPVTGQAVVRERNAHAWAEAWVDGAWLTVDPTPLAELAGRPKPSWVDHLSDAWSTYVDRIYTAALRAGPVRIAVVVVLALAAVLALPRLRAALRARRRAAGTSTGSSLPAFVVLETALASAGHPREPSEPLERFAERLGSLTEPWAGAAAEALHLYAALRYGGRGDVSRIVRVMTEAAALITSAAPRADAP